MAHIEPAQLAQWYDAHAAALVLYARQWVRGELAEDAVQEVFVRLASQPQPPEHVRAWLITSVRHAALDASKMARRRQTRQQEAGLERARWFASASAAGEAGTGLDATLAQAHLEQLPATEREIITLRIWAGATFEEIAQIVGLPLSTVYNRYRSGLAQLRTRWELPCQNL